MPEAHPYLRLRMLAEIAVSNPLAVSRIPRGGDGPYSGVVALAERSVGNSPRFSQRWSRFQHTRSQKLDGAKRRHVRPGRDVPAIEKKPWIVIQGARHQRRFPVLL